MKSFLQNNIGITVIGLIGLILSFVVYSTLDRWQNERVKDSFSKRVIHKHNLLEDIVRVSESKLISLKAFFDNSVNVTREEFQGFSESLFSSRNKKLDCYFWIPEQEPATTGSSQDGQPSSKRVGQRSFPVFYKYKRQFPLFEVGTDIRENKWVRKAVQKGRSTRISQATEPFQVDIGEEKNWVVLLLYPVFDRQSPSETALQFKGFASGVFDLTESIKHIFHGSPSVFARLHTSPEQASFLQYPSEAKRTTSLQSLGWKRYFIDEYRQQKTISIAHRPVTVVYTAGPEFLSRVNVLLAPAVALMVLVLTGLLMLYIGDLKNRKRVIEEKVEEQTRKLKKANRAKSEFLAQMSHEIRTPLNAIMGMTDLLRQTSVDEEQNEYIRISKESCEVLLNLINDILDLSKIEAGQLELNREPFKLEPFVNDTVSYFAREAAEKGLELHVLVEGDCPAVVHEDKNRLRQVLINLVQNAIKYTETGEVNVGVRFEENGEENRLHFEIEDTGIGIPDDKQDGLFERFSQLDASNDRGGTGLGLSITRELVELMDGEIEVESEVGNGSTFHVRIPVHLLEEDRMDTLQRVDAPGSDGDFSDLDVLVVDDSSTNRLLLNKILDNWGAEVTEAENGEQAIETIERRQRDEEPFDLILLDRELPDRAGFEVVEHMKNQQPIDHVVVMLSSDEQRGDRNRADELGIGDYLVKPVDRSELQETINQVLQEDGFTEIRETSIHQRENQQRSVSASVLIAEDNKHNRKLMKEMLRDHPIELEFAEDGEEALDMATSNPYDLIFMDIRMPDMNGLDVTRAYRSQEDETDGSTHTPIVALTAQALDEHRKESLDAGCDEHLSKPVSEQELIDVIRHFVEDSDVAINDVEEPEISDQDYDQHLVIDRRFEEFIPDLRDDILEEMDRVKDLSAQRQFDDIRDIAHDVKGAAASYGFDRIQDLAEDIEEHAGNQEPDEIASNADEVIEYLQQVTIKYT